MKYKCTIDQNQDGGIWEKKETPKTISFTFKENSLIFEPNYKQIKINKSKPNNDCLRDWQDGTYTAYPRQCGIPYYFEPYDTNTKNN